MGKFDQIIEATYKGKKKNTHKPGYIVRGAPKGGYKIPRNKKGGSHLIVDSKDHESFIELFTKKPNSITGNGEISLYWLFNNTGKPGKQVAFETGAGGADSKGGGAADLLIHGKSVEVKSYPSHETMTLGKFKDDKDSLEIFSYLFSFVNLFIKFGTSKKSASNPKGERAFKSVLGFNIDDIVSALGYYDVLHTVFMSDDILKKIVALENAGAKSTEAKRLVIQKKKEFVTFVQQLKQLKIISKGTGQIAHTLAARQETAAKIISFFLRNKLKDKPGDGGYMVNCLTSIKGGKLTNDSIHFYKVNLEKIMQNLNYTTLQQGFSVSSGEIQITKASAIFV